MNKRYQVFVSSTYKDLIEERKEATQAILKCNCFPAGMELFPASNKKQWNVIKQVIDDSDFYLLILAGRYGSLGIDDLGNKVGYTEMEFDYAVSKEKPIIVMLHRNPETLPAKLTERTERSIKRLEKFREKAMNGRMVAFWDNKDQLNGEILSSLHKMMSSTPEAVGWVRADFIVKSNNTYLNSLSTIEELKKINKFDEKIEYLEDKNSSVLAECFKNIEFANEFIDLFNSIQSSDLISRAIHLIPKLNYKIEKRFKKLIDIDSLFFKQCKDGIYQETEISNSIIRLLIKLDICSDDYLEPMFNAIKAINSSFIHVKNCFSYIDRYGSMINIDTKIELWKYVMDEFKNEHRKLSINYLSHMVTCLFDSEDEYVYVYNIFVSYEKNVQREILYSMFCNCGVETCIITPKIQRMFFNMCNTVFLWDDDQAIADLLLYCLFVRTIDIFTVDEIYDKLGEFNDDVFYIFIWRLCYGEFGMGAYEFYEIDEEEVFRINEIIKERKHPREKKLLEHLSLLKY